jgi:hypothetical protein
MFEFQAVELIEYFARNHPTARFDPDQRPATMVDDYSQRHNLPSQETAESGGGNPINHAWSFASHL